MSADLSVLPTDLRQQAVALGQDFAWPAAAARGVIDLLQQSGLAVVGVELWVPAGANPRVLGWSRYHVPFTGNWKEYARENAAEALAELNQQAPPEALYLLTWLSREEASHRQSGAG